MQNLKINKKILRNYNIVVPQDCEYYIHKFANELKFYFSDSLGIDLQFDNLGSGANLISIGKKDISKFIYSIEIQSSAIILNAGSIYAYDELLDFLKRTFGTLETDVELYPVSSEVSFNGCAEYLIRKFGEIRFMTYNVYGYDSGAVANSNGCPAAVRQPMQLDMINAYAPDVFGMQEYSNSHYREFTPKLVSAGYTEVPAGLTEIKSGIEATNYTPMFYKTDKLKLVESGFFYYEGPNDKNSKTLTWAVFKTVTDGKKFAAIATHFWWKGDAEANLARVKNAEDLISVILKIREKYPDIPVIAGGDLNCRNGSDPLNALINAGMKNLREEAEKSDDSAGHHPYPVYSHEAECFVKQTEPIRDSNRAIDHIFAYGNISAKAFSVITDRTSLLTSDHSPMIVDFSI